MSDLLLQLSVWWSNTKYAYTYKGKHRWKRRRTITEWVGAIFA